IALSVSGLPRGITAKFAPSSLASPGNGSSTLTLSAATTMLGGVYPLTVTGSGGGVNRNQAFSLTVVVPSFTLTLGSTKVILVRGGAMPITLTTTAINGFKSGVGLSVSGMPRGVTGSFAPVNIASPSGGRSTLTL